MIKIGYFINKAVNVRLLRNMVSSLLWFCLPSSVYIKLTRWLSNKVNQAHIYGHQSHFIKDNKTPVFGIVSPLNQKKVVDVVICCAFRGRHEILEKSIIES